MPTLSAVLERFGGRVWSAPAYLDYVQPPLTGEAAEAAERELGVRLPGDYLALLQVQNGGYLRGAWPDREGDLLFGIGPQYPNLVAQQPDWEGGWAPTDAKRLIAFDGDGHWFLCLDYRRCGPRGEPGVTFVDEECSREEPLADSFLAYVGGIVDKPGAELRVYGAVTLDDVASRLAPVLGVAADDDGGASYGYRVRRFALPGGEWAWLKPNEVPAGFKRADGRVITTDATALRLPQDAACAVSIGMTEGAVQAVVDAITAAGLRWWHPGSRG